MIERMDTDATKNAKVLICAVDGGWFAISTEWVEAVCPRASVSEQVIRVADQPPQAIHRVSGRAGVGR